MTKAERRRQNYEFNKKLWEEAETPNAPYFVQKSDEVPLQSGFAPKMKVLSRRPNAATSSTLGAGADGDDEEEEERKAAQRSLDERIEKAKQEREEKQRKYEEVRQRLFGTPDAEQKPAAAGRGNFGPQQQRRGSGRGRSMTKSQN